MFHYGLLCFIILFFTTKSLYVQLVVVKISVAETLTVKNAFGKNTLYDHTQDPYCQPSIFWIQPSGSFVMVLWQQSIFYLLKKKSILRGEESTPNV